MITFVSAMSVHGRSFIAGLFVPVAIIAALLFITDYSELLTSIEQLRAQGNSVNRSSIWQQQTGPPAQHGVAQWQQLNLTSNWTFPGVTCCSSEGDEPLCPWCNKTFTTRYPLQEAEHFQRSFIPGGPCAMPPGLLQKLKTGQPVKINVVGGSMTAGKFCNDKGRHQSACAWPARMRDRLLQLFPRADITVTNMAKPGFSYTSFMSTGSVHDLIDADVLFIDLQVNSQVSVRIARSRHLARGAGTTAAAPAVKHAQGLPNIVAVGARCRSTGTSSRKWRRRMNSSSKHCPWHMSSRRIWVSCLWRALECAPNRLRTATGTALHTVKRI